MRKADGVWLHPSYGRLMEHKGYSLRIYWSGRMLADLKRYYPQTLNDELAELLGVSVRTMIRKARELGIEKDAKWLWGIWDERRLMARAASRLKGYPGCFKKGNETGKECRFKPGHAANRAAE